MLEIKNLSIKVKDRFLIKDLSFTLHNNDKLAIIGEEGNGKSTLLKAIIGICDYAEISGSIHFKNHSVGYLAQSVDSETQAKRVYDYLFQDEKDYYEKVNTFYQYINKFQLDECITQQYIHTLSGGEKVKLGVLKLLLNEYDILLFDEPTNDLDIEALEWLEGFINHTTKPIIYVSHDEALLANSANMVLHLEQIKKKTACRHTLLRLDYDTYTKQRIRKIDRQAQSAKAEKRAYQKQQETLNRIMQKVAYQQETISRSNPHGAKVLKKKMHSLKAHKRQLDHKELIQMPDVEEGIFFAFEAAEIPAKKCILDLKLPVLKAGDKILSENIALTITGNPHLCIIGKNGIGKSTLIKIIYKMLKDRSDLNVGYMPQEYDDIFNRYASVMEFISPSGEKAAITQARMYLGNMKFTKEEMTGRIADLSNGSKAKLLLTKLVLDQCNVLILDEPTRNVSPLSNPVIRKALKEYTGTIISISHDRKYIDEVIDSLYELTDEGLIKIK